jgi:hypothetical protein
MGGTIWTQPSPSDFDRWEALLLAGQEPSTAAKSLGHTCSAFRRADPARHAELLELSREARGANADERGEKWALDQGASDQMRLAWLKRWQPAWAGLQKVEVTGADGGPVEVEHKGGLTLADVAAFANDRSDPGAS